MNIPETSGSRLTYTIISNEDLSSKLEKFLLFLRKQEKLLLLGFYDQDQFMCNVEVFVRL